MVRQGKKSVTRFLRLKHRIIINSNLFNAYIREYVYINYNTFFILIALPALCENRNERRDSTSKRIFLTRYLVK